MIALVCPSCRGPLVWEERRAVCEREGIEYPVREGMPELIVPGSRERVRAFLDRYLAVRHDERWTDDDRETLLALPFEDLTGQRAWMWRVRARGLRALRGELRRRFGERRLRVCERGAGVAWLSYRLALDGHEVVATDVNADSRDGLGAARHYVEAGASVRRVLAEMDRLPFEDAAFDVVVNAASFHYAPDQRAALAEAARAVGRGGVLVILDSPVYSTRAAGEAMAAEWRERLAAKYRTGGADSGYLVRGEIEAGLAEAGFDARFVEHFMGWRWTAQYWRARVRGHREPARLPMIVGEKR